MNTIDTELLLLTKANRIFFSAYSLLDQK